MFNTTEYNNNCNYLTIAYNSVTKLFTYTLKTPNDTFLLTSPTCVEHDLEHLLYGLGYSIEEEDYIDECSLEREKMYLRTNLADEAMVKLNRRLSWEHPTLVLNNWYYFLKELPKLIKEGPFEVGFYFLPNKTKLMYAM